MDLTKKEEADSGLLSSMATSLIASSATLSVLERKLESFPLVRAILMKIFCTLALRRIDKNWEIMTDNLGRSLNTTEQLMEVRFQKDKTYRFIKNYSKRLDLEVTVASLAICISAAVIGVLVLW